MPDRRAGARRPRALAAPAQELAAEHRRAGMNEAAARETVLVRAIETADAGRAVWSDEDRAWATRAASEITGSDAAPDTFVARRASLALERLRTRHPAFARALRAVTWRPWIVPVLAVAAFALGIAADQLGPTRRVNILAFPLLALLAGTSWSTRSSPCAASGGSSPRAGASSARSRARSRGSDARSRASPSSGMRRCPRCSAIFFTEWARASRAALRGPRRTFAPHRRVRARARRDRRDVRPRPGARVPRRLGEHVHRPGGGALRCSRSCSAPPAR